MNRREGVTRLLRASELWVQTKDWIAMPARSLLARIYRLTVVRGGGLALTLGLTALQAAAFGTGPAGDAFHLVRQFLASLTSGIEAGVQKLLVPHFVARGGGALARRRLLWWLGGGGLFAAILMAALAPWMLKGIAPGFDVPRQDQAVLIFRVLVFGLPAYALTAVLASQAFAERRFSLATFAGLLPRIFGVAGFAVVGFSLTAYGLAGWLLAGMAGMLVLVWISRIWQGHQVADPKTELGLPSGLSANRLAAILVIIASQVLLTWSNAFLASLGPAGSAAILFLALRLINAVPSLAHAAVSTVYYTEFAHAAHQDTAARADHIRASLATSAFFILPVCGLLLVAAEPIIAVLLERGSFTEVDKNRMARLIPILAPVLIFNAIFAALQNAIMAQISGRVFRVILATAGSALVLRLAVGLALVPVMGLVGLAVAFLVSAAGQAFLIFVLTFKELRTVFSMQLVARISAIVLCTLLASSLAYFADQAQIPIWATLGLFGVVYFLFGYVLRVPEVRQIMPQRFRRWF